MVDSFWMAARSKICNRRWLLACLLCGLLLVGCDSGASPELPPDSGPPRDRSADRDASHRPDHGSAPGDTTPDAGAPPLPDEGTPKPDVTPPPNKAHKVAAIQYSAGNAPMVNKACAQDATPNVCALTHMVAQAQAAGATLVVLPEYGFGWDQKVYEPDPSVGDNPATNFAWPQMLFISTFARAARQHKIYLVIHLTTQKVGSSPVVAYNTQVAFDPTGKVVGKHHKFNLWDDEPKTLTAGTDVSVFSSPLGNVGLLICADIYGTAALRTKLAKTLKARVVAFSGFWLTAGAPTYQAGFAKTYGVYLVAANTTLGPGQGGGVYDTAGKTMAGTILNTPGIIYATIPAP